MAANDKRSDRDDAPSAAPRHPSYDPSGNEPAGSSSGLGHRDLADVEFAEAEAEQARGRRESAATRDDTALGPHTDDPH